MRREQVADVIPGFMTILTGLVECFRVRESIFGGRGVGSDGKDGMGGQTWKIFTQHGPLPIECADNLNRLLLLVCQKSTSSASTSTTTATVTHAKTLTERYVKPFSKHAPFFVGRWCGVLASDRPVEVERRKRLEGGIWGMVELCGKFGREAVLSGVDAETRGVVKVVVGEWERGGRWAGKV